MNSVGVRYGLQPMAPGRVNQAWLPAPKPDERDVVVGGFGYDSHHLKESQRPSGGKRDHDDTLNTTSNSSTTCLAPAKKKNKVTYALPNQCMEQGHFYVVLGEDVDVSQGRYKILSMLGQGTFGKVVEAWDRKRKQYCAVKIVRNVPKYTRDATVEVQYMERIGVRDIDDKYPFVKVTKHFINDQGHMCIVMNKYGMCLLDWMQRNGPFSLRNIAEIAFHTGMALDYLHTTMRMIHTDLKPENILLERNDNVIEGGRVVPAPPLRIRVCDLGGCCDERHSRTAVVSTRHYRAPEVILGLGWMYPADMWSMGCILFELFSGKLLFDTHDNLEHLHMMARCLGQIPEDWGPHCGLDDGKVLFTPPMMSHLRPPAASSAGKLSRARTIRESIKDDLFYSLIQGLLCYDKNRRTTAKQMATHPFVAKYFPESVALANTLYGSSSTHRTPLQPPVQ